jgi:N6-adenosine-specific RNA methylase IME4/ParB-like chromosome segregation protein Spo0J
LADDELRRLTASIRAHGVQIPVLVDEDGAVLDGHHRLMIAEELGIDYPLETRRGLSAHEKRLLAVSLNIDRRQLNTTQLAVLYGLVKPDFERRARTRMAEAGAKSAPGKRATNGTPFAPKRAADEAAKHVGLGSGRNAERLEKVVKEALALGILTTEQIAPERPSDVPPPPDVRELKQQVDATKRGQQAAAIRHEPPPLPTGPFRVIVADPPWRYEKRPDDLTQRGRVPYPTMCLEDIARMPVTSRAHADCILWLWTTNAHMQEAYMVLDAWGFTPKTILTWVKDRMGTGEWLRGQTEHCLLAVRGKPIVQLTNQTTVLQGPVREHSRKPDEFYAMVAALCPGARLELFARRTREGFVVWGNEVAA